MFPTITESQALRSCNLPDTPHWRNWLRSKLAPQEISTGRIYDRAMVDLLAAKIRPATGDIVLPPEPQRQAPAVPRTGHSGPVAAEPVINRSVAPGTLHTR
jgi:hypothetical protein